MTDFLFFASLFATLCLAVVGALFEGRSKSRTNDRISELEDAVANLQVVINSQKNSAIN